MNHHKKKAACAAMLTMAMALPFGAIAENETRVVTAGTLNLREGASTESTVIGKYGWGTQVDVLGFDGDWAYVDVNGQNGYMYAKYLGDESAVYVTRYVNTNTRGLNLRAKPNGTILGSYPRGTAVTVLSTQNGWSEVKVNGQSGYMSSLWLSSKKPASNSTSGSTSIGSATVANPKDTQVLFLRSKPTVESESLGYYRNGKHVTLLEKLDGWYKVSVDGKTGYMMAKFLNVTAAHSGSATVVNPNGNSYVNFRSGASLSASVLSTVPVGTNITVLEKTTDWTKTEIDGKTGYISTWFLKF